MEGWRYNNHMKTTEQMYKESNKLHLEGVKREEIALNTLGYTIDNEGVVSNRFKDIIGGSKNRGYNKFQVTLNRKIITIFSHRLQAYKKYGSKIYEKGIMVRHKDDVKTNNCVDNILIGTAKDNAQDRINIIGKEAFLKQQRKASEKTIKYPDELVVEIREFYKVNGNAQKLTMEKYGISSSSTLWYIINKRKVTEWQDEEILSDCCGAQIVHSDLCFVCGEHA